MPRGLSTYNLTESARHTSRPGHLLRFSFDETLYVSSRLTLTYESQTWLEFRFDSLEWSDRHVKATLVDRENLILDSLLHLRKTQLRLDLWLLYEGEHSDGDADHMFSGLLQRQSWTDGRFNFSASSDITFVIPNMPITPETGFNHLPKDGTSVKTPDGTIVLTNR